MTLAGCGVLVTRPAEQAAGLAAGLAAAGARVWQVPTIAITALPPPLPTPADWLVFVSANAVRHAGAWLPPPAGTRSAAIGPATRAALVARGFEPAAAGADGRGAAALLADPRFAAGPGSRVSILRGVGGSDALASALRARGALPQHIEVYRRDPPGADAMRALAAARSHGVHAVQVASNTALEHLHSMLDAPGRAWLAGLQVVGVSPRVVDLARTLGIRTPPLVAGDASDDAQIAALIAWWGARPTP